MDPYSLRKRLGVKKFEPLPLDKYLERLRVVVDGSAPPEQRNAAKDDLFNAHLGLIAREIRRLLDATRAKGGYAGARDGIGIDESSDLFDSMAGHMYHELTEMALAAVEGGFRLGAAISHRVGRRLVDKIKKATAQKRTADFEPSELLGQLAANNGAFSDLEEVLLRDARSELCAATDDLPETERLVVQTLMYGFETGQDLTVAQVARELGIPETTARSAFKRAREKLQRRFPEFGELAKCGK